MSNFANFIDRAIGVFSPSTAMKRQLARKALHIANTGYSEGGASHQKKSMKGWNPIAGDPASDINRNLNTLRARSRDLFMNSPVGASAINTTVTNVVGLGLKLRSRIDAKFLGMTEEQANEWERNTEREFALWAESKFCDATRTSDFYDMQELAFLGFLMNGDSFAVFKREEATSFMPYTLRIHLVESDRVCTPIQYDSGTDYGLNNDNGNEVISGVEVDKYTGATVAYHVANTHGSDLLKPREWVRLEAFGKDTGAPNVLHLYRAERAEQRRGVPLLTPVMESLKQLTRYTEAELMASVLAGFFTVFVKSERPDTLFNAPDFDEEADDTEPAEYGMSPGMVNVLAPGESIEVANPGRPNSQFDAFTSSLTKYIGAALEIPSEILLKSFTASYSASRAALLEAWKVFKKRRNWLAKEFCQPVYEEWLSEAIASGRIKAPGFFTNPIIRKAWCSCEWNGPAPGQIDPLKEVVAAEKRIDLGLSTRERETIELTGGDFDLNIAQLLREKEMMDKLVSKTVEQVLKSLKGGEGK